MSQNRKNTTENDGGDTSNRKRIEILRVKEVQKLTGLSRSSLWRKVKSCSMPSPVKLGANSIGFYAHEIEAYLLSLPRVTTDNDRS